MKTRIITAVVALCALMPVLLLSQTIIFPVAMSICAMIAVYEVMGCIDVRKKWSFFLTTLFFSAMILSFSVIYFVISAEMNMLPMIFALTYIYVFLIFAFTMFSKGEIKFNQATKLVALTMYVLIGFISIILLRREPSAGQYIYLLVFIGAWTTDTGAYFVGVFFGKHKLIPEVSPKKTVEGALGGILGCVLGYLIFGMIVSCFFNATVNFISLSLLAVAVSIISQCGDLIASYVKREHGIKDYGSLFPGHGGIMDRFDSIIAVAPIILVTVLLLPESLQLISS